MTRRSNSRPRRSRSGRPRHRSPSPITRARRRSHRSRSPPTHRRRNSPPPSSTPMQSTNLPPLPRLRRRHPTPAPTSRPDTRRSRSLSRRRPLRPRSPRPYRSPATFTTPRPIEHQPLHRPRQPDQRRQNLAHTSPDISSDTAPRRPWLHSRPTITLKPNPHSSHSTPPPMPPPRCPAPPAQYTSHRPPPDTHSNPTPPSFRPPRQTTPRPSNPTSTHFTLPSDYQRIDFPIDHMLTHHFPPNQPSTSDTTSTPLQLPEIRRSMNIPNYKQLQETLTTAQQRANWLAPHWQLYQNLTIHHPTTRQYLQALDEAHLPNQEMLPDNVQQYLARAMATTGFPFSSIKSISHHTYQNKNIWRVALTKLPGSLQPQSMLQGVYKYAHATHLHLAHRQRPHPVHPRRPQPKPHPGKDRHYPSQHHPHNPAFRSPSDPDMGTHQLHPAPSPSPSPTTHPATADAPNSAATSMPPQPLHIQHPELATVIQPTKPLSTDALPTAYSATKIQKWIAQHNNPELTEHVREITAILAKIPKKEQPNLAETAVRFGLPMAGATSMTYKTLSQFCAAASHLAAWLAHQLHTTQLPTSQHQQLHRDIHTTARCLEHLIHHHPAIDKHHLIFTHGLLHLTCIFHFSNTSQRHQHWKQFFLQHHITPDSYTLSRTQQTPAVYIKLPFHHYPHRTYHQTGHYYIGSTNIGTYKREFNRQAKLKQLRERKTPHVELALRWWHTNHNYQQYSTLFLLSTSSYTQAWAQEHALIQQHRSPLNFPYIQQHLHRTAFAFHIKPNKLHFSRTHTAKRLWRRVRRATRSLHRNQTPTERNIQSWTTLYHLASFNRQRFDTSKHLRSGATTNWDVYALWRLAQHVEQPERSRCLSELRSILHFRNCTIPKGNKPLTLPFLSHPTFSTQVKHWLRKHIVGHKNLAIPLHLATHRPREQAHLSLNSILHNFRQWDNISLHDLPPCNCANFLLQHPHAEHQSGHIATTLDTLTLPPHLQHYRHCNGLSTAFPTWERYKQQITNTFFQWLKHHGMPVQNTDHITNKLHKFLQQQWHQHKQYLATHTFFHVPEVFELKRIITDQFIIHHADHETARPRIFCPHLYLKAASTTWGDPKLFTPLPDSPSEANTTLLHTIPTWLAQKYKWGINTQSTLPQGFVFLKQKKQWAKGRTIISYRNSTLARLLKAVAIALDTMVRQTWPSAPGNASTPELWKALHNYMHTTSTSIHLNMINDDLVGFFNSVPHEKLQHSLHILIHQWRQKHNQDTITVDTTRALGSFHSIHTGSFRPGKRTPNHKVLHIQHIPDIVHLSFQFSVFQALGQTWQQIQGTGIGNQISPILANIPITLHEVNWQQAFQQQLHHLQTAHGPYIFLRYVDNRMIIAPQPTFNSLPFRTLALHDFYQLPIQLELVGDSHFLGFTLHLANRSITFNQPTSPWQIRDACSAGSRRLTLSGLLSRGTTIHRYSFPSNIVHSSLETLLQAYISKGHNETLCRHTLKKLFNTCNPVAWIRPTDKPDYFANFANMQRANWLSWTSMTSATMRD